MNTKAHSGRILKGVGISIAVNGLLVVSAFTPASSLFTKVANAIAAAPGLIALRMFSPGQHTTLAFIGSAIASLLLSLVFYALLAWAMFEIFACVRRIFDGQRGGSDI